MRTIIFMSGLPGSGKSTFINSLGLKSWTICPDDIRLLYQAPEYGVDGTLHISIANDNKVWKLVYELTRERMERGEFTIIDATFNLSLIHI